MLLSPKMRSKKDSLHSCFCKEAQHIQQSVKTDTNLSYASAIFQMKAGMPVQTKVRKEIFFNCLILANFHDN